MKETQGIILMLKHEKVVTFFSGFVLFCLPRIKKPVINNFYFVYLSYGISSGLWRMFMQSCYKYRHSSNLSIIHQN